MTLAPAAAAFRALHEAGTFDGLAGLAPFAELNQIFEGKER